MTSTLGFGGVTMTGQEKAAARTAMRDAIRKLLDELNISQSELARQLTQAASDFGLKRGDADKEVQYDPAMVNRWRDGKLVMSRQAAWLLDHLHPEVVKESFQDLRDRYILAHDREQVAEPTSTGNRTLLSGASCSAEALANRLPHRRLPLEPDETMAIIFLSVVDVDDTRDIVSALVDRTDDVRVVAMYDVLGHWDVMVRLAGPRTFDFAAFYGEIHAALVETGMAGEEENPAADVAEFTGHRFLTTDLSRIRPPGAARPPTFVVLDESDDYDLYRMQRAFLFVELNTVPELRRAIARKAIEKLVREDLPHSCGHIVEAVTFADDAVILEIMMTCANGIRRLNQLNRIIGPHLTRFKAQKTNLLVFASDERGWPSPV
jgi:hypothetical protein